MNQKIVVVTGSLGLIGYETTLLYLNKGYMVIGIDNNLREKLFNIKTKFSEKLLHLQRKYNGRYFHNNRDIREEYFLKSLFKKHGNAIGVVIHTAAQTSHDWAKKNPLMDYSVNADATLYLLESVRQYTSDAVFIFTSTNKVYGDTVNKLPFKEYLNRYDLLEDESCFMGIDEFFSIDHSLHSLFGVSKTSADLLVQEYGKYFGLRTGVFRLGVVAGGGQSGALYQGFLSYLIEKAVRSEIFCFVGYKGKQVRDIIHARDVVQAFYLYSQKPKKGEVYNLGGGRRNSFSLIELVKKVYQITGKKIRTKYIKKSRKGDHKWWVTDNSKFKRDFSNWNIHYSVEAIIAEIYQSFKKV